MRRLLQLQMSQFVETRGKAAVLDLDDFGRYIEAKRAEQGKVSPFEFWVEFLLTLAFIVAGSIFLVGFAIAAPVFRAFLLAQGV